MKLGPEFKAIQEYQKRFRNGMPDIMELDQLTVSGNVHFGRGIKLKGAVIIVASEGAELIYLIILPSKIMSLLEICVS